MLWANCPIAVPVCASTEGGQTPPGAPLNASKLQICRMHRDRGSANPNLSPWGNQGCVTNPPRGNGLLRTGVQISAGSHPRSVDTLCVPSKHREGCSTFYSWEIIP